MISPPKITISAYRRPDMLERTLNALNRCEGIARYRPVVVVDHGEKQLECGQLAEWMGARAILLPRHFGCTETIRYCMDIGFSDPKEFHIHFEDDIVPTRGALLFLEWAAERFKDDLAVMAASVYSRDTDGAVDQYTFHPHFCSWGWGTWFDRWAQFSNTISGDGISWDTQIDRTFKPGQRIVRPVISRCQNIGATDGTYLPSEEYHRTYHHTELTTDATVRGFTEAVI